MDNDSADTVSLDSTIVLDLFTDRIVAEYTGRQDYVDDSNEITRKLCLFYNATLLYENNKKSVFGYFQKMHSLHLLADTPQYLKDKQIIKVAGSYGNTSKGVNSTLPIINYGLDLLRDWLLKPVETQIQEGNEIQTQVTQNLYFLKGRAMLQELIYYNPFNNYDRVSALIMLMIYREQFLIMYEGDVSSGNQRRREDDPGYAGNDEFFRKNFNDRFAGKLKDFGD